MRLLFSKIKFGICFPTNLITKHPISKYIQHSKHNSLCNHQFLKNFTLGHLKSENTSKRFFSSRVNNYQHDEPKIAKKISHSSKYTRFYFIIMVSNTSLNMCTLMRS